VHGVFSVSRIKVVNKTLKPLKIGCGQSLEIDRFLHLTLPHLCLRQASPTALLGCVSLTRLHRSEDPIKDYSVSLLLFKVNKMKNNLSSVPENSFIKLTIAFDDPDLDSEELEEQAQNLLAQMRDLDEIETIDRAIDPNPPEGNKSVGAILAGLLTAQVNKENAQIVMRFLFDRIGPKPIELEVEANGKRLKVKASSQAELKLAIEAAEKFIEP
jgi:hypothetical protein